MGEKTVAIFGTSRAEPDTPVYIQAETIGRLLAQAGFTIANGGYGGTMLAAAKGARQAGGKVIGVTCSAFERSTANKYITEEIVTDSLDQRLAKLTELADAYVVLQGSTGTLLELARVWELKNKGFISSKKPIILAGGFWQRLVDLMLKDDPGSSRCIRIAQNPQEIRDILVESI